MTDEQFQAHMELNSAIYIQLCRIYDILLVTSDKQGVDSIAIKEMHTEGRTFSPYPALIENESEDEENS
jgi:hypothetical protein